MSDLHDIERALWTYLDGLYAGDTAKIASVFDPVCHLYGEDAGKVTDETRDRWLDRVRSRPSAQAQGLPRVDRIVSVDQSSRTTAFAKVECAIQPRHFVDYLTLIKTAEGWRIVAKAYTVETR